MNGIDGSPEGQTFEIDPEGRRVLIPVVIVQRNDKISGENRISIRIPKNTRLLFDGEFAPETGLLVNLLGVLCISS